jgi:hypothetical protein
LECAGKQGIWQVATSKGQVVAQQHNVVVSFELLAITFKSKAVVDVQVRNIHNLESTKPSANAEFGLSSPVQRKYFIVSSQAPE